MVRVFCCLHGLAAKMCVGLSVSCASGPSFAGPESFFCAESGAVALGAGIVFVAGGLRCSSLIARCARSSSRSWASVPPSIRLVVEAIWRLANSERR